MKIQLLLFCIIALTCSICGARSEEPARTESDNPALRRILEMAGVLEYKELQVKMPPLVSTVTWQVRTNGCSVSVEFDPVRPDQQQPERPRIQAWLLKTDGTVIPQNHGPQKVTIVSGSGIKIDATGCAFPAAARDEACAVVISIGEEFFVERLLPRTK